MKKLTLIVLTTGVIALAALFASITLRDASAAWPAACGPGAHWVDGCTPGGTDTMSSTIGTGTSGSKLRVLPDHR